MKIEIKHRVTRETILSGDYDSLKDCVGKNHGADLRGADPTGITGYSQSHDIFNEIVRRQSVSMFTDAEWVAIAQITIHRLCWDSINKRFSPVMPSIFAKLAEAGFPEWQKHWNEEV